VFPNFDQLFSILFIAELLFEPQRFSHSSFNLQSSISALVTFVLFTLSHQC